MKINFSKAVLTKLDGTPITNQAGEPVYADVKHLATKIYESSMEAFPMAFLDKLEIAQKLNKGEEIDLDESAQGAIKHFINTIGSTTGQAINAWLKCLEKEDKKK